MFFPVRRVALVEGSAALQGGSLGFGGPCVRRVRFVLRIVERGPLGLVEHLLVRDLKLGRRVSKHFDAVVGRCGFDWHGVLRLRSAQTVVQHVLVAVHQAHFSLEARVVVVLRRLEVVDASHLRARGQALSGGLSHVVICGVAPQLVKESAFAVASSVERSEATVVAADVGVTTAAVVGVNDGLGVDVGERLSWPLFLNDEVTFSDKSIV